MGMITSIRAPLPVAETPLAPATGQRSPGAGPAGDTAPVAPTALAQAVQQVPPRQSAAHPQLMEASTTAETSAAAAAKAARDAYVKASIAAGINPLPLP